MLVLTSKAPPPPLFSIAVTRRKRSAPSMLMMLPSTAERSVTLPLNGTPVLPGGFQLPVVPLTVPLEPETTPCLMLSTGSATETIATTSEEISVRSVRVVCWLDCASTSSERWSANG